MAHNHRELISESISELCPSFCNRTTNDFGVCPTPCFSVCSSICRFPIFFPPPDLPTFPTDYHPPNKPHKLHPFLILTLALLATTFLLVACYAAIFVKRRRRSQPSQPQSDETHDEFIDEDHGPVLDHPIWYIRTVGLQEAIINSITVCKYKRGEGLVEGTECSVCLNEFGEDETLRLLPKCNHAFHIPCIDTWLRSHTNCPICRAGIVTSAAFPPSPEPSFNQLSSSEETQEGISANNGQSIGEREDEVEEDGELQVENEGKRDEHLREDVDDDIQPMRRSVSMDSISASKISLALANVLSVGSDGNSKNHLVKASESNMGDVANRIGGNQSLLKFMGSSSIGRSLQNGPISMKRSSSCTGKFLLSRYSRSRNSVLPL